MRKKSTFLRRSPPPLTSHATLSSVQKRGAIFLLQCVSWLNKIDDSALIDDSVLHSHILFKEKDIASKHFIPHVADICSDVLDVHRYYNVANAWFKKRKLEIRIKHVERKRD